ncbi:hypothetical protein [Hymenobacter koreensis]|uniref:Uncharacterized protein n=1 Tax=Hymenobacter koreensis TaxID=1084523 RepID=A0ABP8IX91_9BACT
MATNNTSGNTDFFGNSSANQPSGVNQTLAGKTANTQGGVMGGINDQLTKFGNAASGQLGKLSTTQKVVGGLALAFGISYLSKMNKRNG